MAEDPNTYTTGDEVTNVNMPDYQAPDLQWLYDAILGNVGDVKDIVKRLIGSKPSPMLPAIMKKLGITGSQMGQWFMNNVSGKGTAERANQWKDVQMNRLNRFATKQAGMLQQGAAETGGAGSSSAARQLAEGKVALQGARNDVTAAGFDYEDRLRKEKWDRAMSGMGAVTSLGRGDAAQALQYASMLPAAGNLLLGGGEQMAGVGGMQAEQTAMENAWNQYMYNQYITGNGSGFGINSPWGGVNF